MTVTGGCRCGAVRYSIDIASPPPVYCCHCLCCQNWTGSAFSQQAMIRADALTVTGDLIVYEYRTPSEAISTHHACARCFSRVFNTNTRVPGFALVRAGTFDDSAEINPVAHIWVDRKQHWFEIAPEIPTFPENAPTDVWLKLIIG